MHILAQGFSRKGQVSSFSEFFLLGYGKIWTLANKASKSCVPLRIALQATRVFYVDSLDRVDSKFLDPALYGLFFVD